MSRVIEEKAEAFRSCRRWRLFLLGVPFVLAPVIIVLVLLSGGPPNEARAGSRFKDLGGCPLGFDVGVEEPHGESSGTRRSRREARFGNKLLNKLFEKKRRFFSSLFFPSFHRTTTKSLTATTTTACTSDEVACSTDFPYRTLNGACNNVRDVDSGRAKIPLRRLLPAVYDDGVSGLRTVNPLTGNRLPNPRLVSTTVHQGGGGSSVDSRHTLALMQWGQFLAHDLAMTPKFSQPNGRKLKCDDCTRFGGPCHPIRIPGGDPFYPGSQTCIPFTRSLGSSSSSPGSGGGGQPPRQPREQMNVLSSYIDSSNVYGSDLCKSSVLRKGKNGWMRMLQHPSAPDIFKPLLPTTSTDQECVAPSGRCFFAGEERSSEQPALTAMHTLFAREHNRLADQLRHLNPHWPEEAVFHEARKIVIAVNQHITFDEFLPRVLGPSSSAASSRPFRYDPACTSSVFNEFATAAFRFGHSLVRSRFKVGNEERTPLKDHFFNPDALLKPHYLDRLLMGILTEPMAAFDAHVSEQVTNHLFEVPGRPFSGMDLAAINIQRGRDHGLQGYVSYLRFCARTAFPHHEHAELIARLDSFRDLGEIIGPKAARKLAKVYASVHDVDLFTGGLSEPPLPGGVVGLTFGCIIDRQFADLKRCDRFWYETPDRDVGFTPSQLREIKKVTLASVICRNWDVTDEQKVQRNAFDLPDGSGNRATDCSSRVDHPMIDIEQWRGNPSFVPHLGDDNRTSPSRRRSLFVRHGSRAAAASATTNRTTGSCDVLGKILPIDDDDESRITACQMCSCPRDGEAVCRSSTVPENNCRDLEKSVGSMDAIAADRNCLSICPEAFFQLDNNVSQPQVVSRQPFER